MSEKNKENIDPNLPSDYEGEALHNPDFMSNPVCKLISEAGQICIREGYIESIQDDLEIEDTGLEKEQIFDMLVNRLVEWGEDADTANIIDDSNNGFAIIVDRDEFYGDFIAYVEAYCAEILTMEVFDHFVMTMQTYREVMNSGQEVMPQPAAKKVRRG